MSNTSHAPYVIEISAGPRTLAQYPLWVAVPKPDAPWVDDGPIVITDAATGHTVGAVQTEIIADGGRRLHWVEPGLAPGQSKRYAVHRNGVSNPVALKGVTFDDDGAGTCDVRVGDDVFTTYKYGADWVRPFLDPLQGPSGPVTRRYPMETIEGETHDHPHHKGCWVAWGDVNGTDLWSEPEGKPFGRTIHTSFEDASPGPVFGKLATVNDWLDHAGKRLLTERRTYRFYNTPVTARVFDMTVAFEATEGDVRFGDTKEGGICSVRVATSMDVPKGRFVNGVGGINQGEGWGQRAPWCDYMGPVNGQTVGVAIFDHPSNFRYPTYWHVRDYGLMTANPFGLSYFHGHPGGEPDGSYTLEAGKILTFHYRMVVHAGDTQAADVSGRWHQWVHGPRTAWSSAEDADGVNA